MHRWLPLLLFTATHALPALEVNGDTGYLDRKLRPAWRFASLDSVLDEIAKSAEKPIERSEGVLALQKDSTVCLIAHERVTLKQALAMLESANDLHVSAETLRLRIETSKDFRNKRRRLVNLQLRDWAVSFMPRDAPREAWGFESYPDASGGFMLFSSASGAVVQSDGVDLSEVADWISRAHSESNAEVRAGNLFVMATPEEEQAMRAMLADQFALHTRQVQVRVRFGISPVGNQLPTGIMPIAQLETVVATLQQVSTIDTAAMLGQWASAGTPNQRTGVYDVEVVSERLDPTIESLRVGRGVHFKAFASDEFTVLSHFTAWVDPMMPDRQAIAQVPQSAATPSTTATATESDDKKSQEVTTTLAGAAPASTIAMTMPSIWSWQPRGQIALPRGHGALYCAPHPQGTAVIIWEVLP